MVQGDSSTADATSPESLEALLKSLGDLGLGEGGDENDSELAGFLENMMGQLMSKEVLYEPLKELAEGVSHPSFLPSLVSVNLPTLTPVPIIPNQPTQPPLPRRQKPVRKTRRVRQADFSRIR